MPVETPDSDARHPRPWSIVIDGRQFLLDEPGMEPELIHDAFDRGRWFELPATDEEGRFVTVMVNPNGVGHWYIVEERPRGLPYQGADGRLMDCGLEA